MQNLSIVDNEKDYDEEEDEDPKPPQLFEEDDTVRNETLPDIRESVQRNQMPAQHRLGRPRKTPKSLDLMHKQG